MQNNHPFTHLFKDEILKYELLVMSKSFPLMTFIILKMYGSYLVQSLNLLEKELWAVTQSYICNVYKLSNHLDCPASCVLFLPKESNIDIIAHGEG